MTTKQKQEQDDKWIKLLKTRVAHPYIKPTRYIHDSGFRCFEVGYCTLGEKRTEDALILGKCSDHIAIPASVNMDLTLDGYIRLFSFEDVIWWGTMGYPFSTVTITKLA